MITSQKDVAHAVLRAASTLVSTLVLAVPLLAQSPATVTGKVVDDTGGGIPDLRVSITNQTSKVEKEIRSGADGTFTLQADPGTYAIAIDKPGRGLFAVRDVQLGAGETRTMNLELSAKTDNRNFRYMFYGFLAAWMVLVVYVLSLVARERGLRKQMDDLRRMVESERR
jgi:CcmD family protein